MKVLTRTALCVLLNGASLIPVTIFVLLYSDFKFGPDDQFTILSVKIDTWAKYWGIVVISALLKITEVVLNDIGSPDLGFRVYNPTEVVIYGFTKNQLNVLANAQWFFNNQGAIFRTMLLVSRIDISFMSSLASDIAGVLTVRYLLNKKKAFYPEFETKYDHDQATEIQWSEESLL
jgi:hypothetical protein